MTGVKKQPCAQSAGHVVVHTDSQHAGHQMQNDRHIQSSLQRSDQVSRSQPFERRYQLVTRCSSMASRSNVFEQAKHLHAESTP